MSWTCPTCASAQGNPPHYPSGPDECCDTCGRLLDVQERLAAAVSALVHHRGSGTASSSNEETCDVAEAAKLLHTSSDGVYSMHARGQLPRTIGVGRRLI